MLSETSEDKNIGERKTTEIFILLFKINESRVENGHRDKMKIAKIRGNVRGNVGEKCHLFPAVSPLAFLRVDRRSKSWKYNKLRERRRERASKSNLLYTAHIR